MSKIVLKGLKHWGDDLLQGVELMHDTGSNWREVVLLSLRSLTTYCYS